MNEDHEDRMEAFYNDSWLGFCVGVLVGVVIALFAQYV